MSSRAARDFPDRDVADSTCAYESRARWIEVQCANARPRKHEHLFPGAGIEHTHIISATGRQPARIGAERDRWKIRRIVAQLDEEDTRHWVPDVCRLARC